MKSIPITIAACALTLLASTTARADEDEGEVSIPEGDVSFGPYCYEEEYADEPSDDGGEWGWGWVPWIEIRDPGSCTAFDCVGRCDMWIYGCQNGQCSGDVIWSTCTQVGCDEFSNCA